MTLAQATDLDDQQHIVLEDVSWGLYEQLLEETADRALRITYYDGRLEIMSPLPRHDKWSRRIGGLVQILCMQRRIKYVPAGTGTLRAKARRAGLEPDECYYIKHWEIADKIEERWDADANPPPDLAIEIDITRRSIS